MKSESRLHDDFQGFSRETVCFLKDLARNNEKVWFEDNRQRYEKFVLTPMRQLVTGLSPVILGIDPDFEIRPKINKAISKIYRDVRFSRDKSPFRTTLWIVFKMMRKEWKDIPGYFMEFSAEHYRYGMGYFMAHRATMDSIRAAIQKDEKKFLGIAGFLNSGDIKLEGVYYKKPLEKGRTGLAGEFWAMKSCYTVVNRGMDARFFEAGLVDEMASSFQILGPLYHFFRDAGMRI